MISLLLGLGNIGRKYVGTRHNLGFELLDRVAAKLGVVEKHRTELFDWAEVERRPSTTLGTAENPLLGMTENVDSEKSVVNLRQTQDSGCGVPQSSIGEPTASCGAPEEAIKRPSTTLGTAENPLLGMTENVDSEKPIAILRQAKDSGCGVPQSSIGEPTASCGAPEEAIKRPSTTLGTAENPPLGMTNTGAEGSQHVKPKLILAWPRTYMNCSGDAAVKLLTDNEITPSEMLVLVDDFALPMGATRFRAGGSDGGHNGLASIIESIGTDKFPRLRMGIGLVDKSTDIVDYVLSKFTSSERESADSMLDRATEAVLFVIDHRLEEAMSKYNHNPAPPESA